MHRHRLLVAAHPECLRSIREALRSDFDLTICTTLEEAKWRLSEPHDGLVCGFLFDESRLFDLLRHAAMQAPHLPVVCVKAAGPPLQGVLHEAMEIATRALGARCFIDIDGLATRLGRDAAFHQVYTRVRFALEEKEAA